MFQSVDSVGIQIATQRLGNWEFQHVFDLDVYNTRGIARIEEFLEVQSWRNQRDGNFKESILSNFRWNCTGISSTDLSWVGIRNSKPARAIAFWIGILENCRESKDWGSSRCVEN